MKYLSTSQLSAIKNQFDGGAHVSVITKNVKASQTAVSRVLKLLRDGDTKGFDEKMATAQAFEAKKGGKPSKAYTRILAENGGHKPEIAKRIAKVKELRARGLTLNEIAEKIGISHGSVNYYVYGGKKKYGSKPKNAQLEVSSNGHSNTSGPEPINVNIRIGIAFAETERFIAVLSERLGVSTTVLRSGLSKLLEHSPLR